MATGSRLRDVLSKRHGVLESLAEGAKTKPELVDDIDRSRSTVDRAVDELLEVDCIEPTKKAGSRFRLTVTGEVALQTARQYRSDTATLQSNASLLNALPADAHISRTFLSEAEVYSSAKTPDVAVQPAIDLLPEATKLTGTAPVVLGEYFDVLTEWVRNDSSELEIVLERDLLESLEVTYADELTTLTELDSIELYVLDDRIPYALWTMERQSDVRAGITIYEDGGIKGSFVTDSQRAVRWAREEYGRYKESASKLM